MEDAIVGADIMPMSVHLTASMLASAYPTEQFAKTRLYTLPYGRQEKGHYALGSVGPAGGRRADTSPLPDGRGRPDNRERLGRSDEPVRRELRASSTS